MPSDTPATQVYILLGTTGEYSDRSEWVVCAYTNEADANADCEALKALAVGIGTLKWSERDAAVAERLRPHDAFARSDYTGVDYCVATAELHSVARVPCV